MGQLTLSYVWKQRQIPVILRRTGRGEQLRVRLPFADDNRQWLHNGRRTAPEWIGGTNAYWELPKSWFNDFVDRALLRYGKVYIIQPYREQEICARPARKHAVTNVNARVWEPIMALAMTEAGLKSRIPSLRAGGA
jgi:hypothetical protein